MALAIGGSALLGASASKSAANTQAASADRSIDLQREMFNKQLELQQPFQEAGVNALNRMRSGDVMGMMDPSYQFRLGEGIKALDRQAAARGGLISGGALKAAQRYGQEFASNEFGNAYNRLASMAGLGQTATGAQSTAAGQFGANAGNLMTGAGAARASGYVGGANALTSGLGQYMNYTQSKDLMNRLLPQTGGSPTAMPYSPLYQSQIPGAGA
jgi:hypothetical protein